MRFSFSFPIMVAGIEATTIMAEAIILAASLREPGEPKTGHAWTVAGIDINGHVQDAGGRWVGRSAPLAKDAPLYAAMLKQLLTKEAAVIDLDWSDQAAERHREPDSAEPDSAWLPPLLGEGVA